MNLFYYFSLAALLVVGVLAVLSSYVGNGAIGLIAASLSFGFLSLSIMLFKLKEVALEMRK